MESHRQARDANLLVAQSLSKRWSAALRKFITGVSLAGSTQRICQISTGRLSIANLDQRFPWTRRPGVNQDTGNGRPRDLSARPPCTTLRKRDRVEPGSLQHRSRVSKV